MIPSVDAMVGWLTGHLERFDPASGQAPTERSFTFGPLAELLMCGRALSRELPAESQQFLRYWRELGWRVMDRADSRAQILAQPAYLPFFATIAAIAEHEPTRSLTAELACVGFGEHDLPSRPANARLEARWAFGLVGAFPPSAAAEPELVRSLSTSWLPALNNLTENDAYAYTHCIFYLSDFGAQSVPDGAALIGTTRYLLAWALLRRQLDLAAELLMCLRYLTAADTAIERYGRRALAAGRVGPAVRGPHWSAEIAQRMPSSDRADIYLFRTSFHTTLTAAVALGGLPVDAGDLDQPEELGVIRDLLLLKHGQPCGVEAGSSEWVARSVHAAELSARLAWDGVSS